MFILVSGTQVPSGACGEAPSPSAPPGPQSRPEIPVLLLRCSLEPQPLFLAVALQAAKGVQANGPGLCDRRAGPNCAKK